MVLGALPATGLEADAAREPAAGEPAARFTAPQSDYLLSCGGCHGFDGASNSKFVPDLKGLVGYYLRLPEGRAYLPRLPNVAFSALNDRRLAAVLNYLVFDIGGASTPAGTEPYAAAEVAKWRRQPLTEVTLAEYRRHMVETLIDQHQAPTALRTYDDAGALR